MPDEKPKPITVLEVKRDPRVTIPFALVAIATITAAAMHKITPEVAGLILAALGAPSIVGFKTVPQLVTALLTELQAQIKSLPPPPAMPTGTETPADIATPVPTTTNATTKDEQP